MLDLLMMSSRKLFELYIFLASYHFYEKQIAFYKDKSLKSFSEAKDYGIKYDLISANVLSKNIQDVDDLTTNVSLSNGIVRVNASNVSIRLLNCFD